LSQAGGNGAYAVGRSSHANHSVRMGNLGRLL
jgi:hypothetical protein